MKMMKKIATIVLAICLFVSCFSMMAFAADGKIMFTDPQTKVGETFEITGVVQKTSGNFGKIEIAMKYDAEMLKFVKGDGITESQSGKLTYIGDATNDVGERKEFKFSFEALKEGTTKIEITSATIKNVSGTTLDYTKGSSSITIAAGEGTQNPTNDPVTTTGDDGATVEVQGQSYQIVSEFPESAIPEGYEVTTMEYDLKEYKVVYNEEFGLNLAYLVNEEKAGAFFMYVESDATFAPYKAIEISDSTTIVLLTEVEEVILPKTYTKTTVVMDNFDFPAWKAEDAGEFCVLYALNNYGEKALYQLDNAEGTYQKFIAPEVTDEILDDSFIGKLSDLLQNHLDYVILGTGLGFLLLLIVIIILSVKLYNRNAELDELYDEYGIDLDDKTEEDVVLDVEDEEDEIDDIEYEEEEEEEEQEQEAELVMQNGIKELTQDEETSLGQVLEEVVAQEEKEAFFEDEDPFENFSVDFIDLDD